MIGRAIFRPSEVTIIRTLLTTIACLIAAVSVWAATLAVIWFFGTTEQQTTTRKSDHAIPTGTVPDLAPRLRARHMPVDATGPSPERPRARCRIRIEGQNPQKRLCVAIFDGESGARIGGRDVVASLPHVLTFDSIPVGRHEVRVARTLDAVRSSYLVRRDVKVIATGSAEDVTILCTTRPLRVRLEASGPSPTPGASIADIPVILRREDDPDWRYSPATLTRTDKDGTVTFHDLGPGTYVLSMHGFEPAADQRARLVFRRDEFDQERPIRGLPR